MLSPAHETPEASVYVSRWGYHPVDYATFRMLKHLHKCYWAAVRGLAAWFRWNAKQPQNRIITQRIRDANGRVTGWRVLGPWPEPHYSGLFGHPTEKRPWLTIPEHLDDHGIVEAYQSARLPRPRESVTPLRIPVAHIVQLYNLATARD